jgi:PAS domain S-box-containing protein
MSSSNLFSIKKSFLANQWHSMCNLDCSALIPSQEECCGLAVHYNEAQARPLTYDDELPPPQYYQRPQPHSSPSEPQQRQNAKRNIPTAVLSLVKPHKVLSISKELCDFLGFEAEEMLGRSLNLLHGPKTDAKIVTSAIKNTGLLTSGHFSTTLYARDGSERSIRASCVPYFGEGGVLAGCKLQLLPELPCLELSALHLDEAAAERLQQAERIKRSCYRSKYNFSTGLTIQRSMLRHANTRPPPTDAPDVWA